jgi:hypothetical protein
MVKYFERPQREINNGLLAEAEIQYLHLGMVGHIYSWTLGGLLTFAIPALCTHKINLLTKLKKKYRIFS